MRNTIRIHSFSKHLNSWISVGLRDNEGLQTPPVAVFKEWYLEEAEL